MPGRAQVQHIVKGREGSLRMREQQVRRCDGLCGPSEMVEAGSQGAGKREGRQEVERGQGHEGDAGDVKVSTGWQGTGTV